MASPLFYRTVEAKEILHPLFGRKDRLSIGAIKINQEKLVSCDQNVLKLKVAMKEAGLVKLSDKKAERSNHFSLRGNVFTGRRGFDFVEILNQIHSTWDFHREKISPVEWKEDAMVDGADGRDCRNSARSDFFC